MITDKLYLDEIFTFLTVSTISGGVVSLGRVVIPLNFQDGFLFSGFSLIAIKIAHYIDSQIEKNFNFPPFISGTLFFGITLGLPIAIISRLRPINLTTSIYLTAVAILARSIFWVTDHSPFL